MRVGRPGRRAGMGGLRASRLWLLAYLAGLLVVGSCVEELDLADGEVPVLIRVSLVPVLDSLLANTPRSLTLHRLRLQVVDVETGEEQVTGSVELDPNDFPESFQIRRDVAPGAEFAFEGTLELVYQEGGEDPFESVEWAAFVEPIVVTTEQEEWEFEIEFGRGNLAEQSITALTVTGGQEQVVEGAVLSYSGSVEGGPEGARIFWGTQDPELVSVDEDGTVQTLLPGTARIVVAAALQAEVREIEILQAIVGVEVLPEEERLTAIGQQAQFTARVLDPRGDEVLGRAVEWSVVDSTVALNRGDGVFEAARVGSTEVIARAGEVEGRATLIVEGESGGGLIRWTSAEGGSWTDANNWDLGRSTCRPRWPRSGSELSPRHSRLRVPSRSAASFPRSPDGQPGPPTVTGREVHPGSQGPLP